MIEQTGYPFDTSEGEKSAAIQIVLVVLTVLLIVGIIVASEQKKKELP